ncbi:TolC family protein [Cyclobacterium salsum]|uniref:TolC family protein n=1 Tax=Cyclobacterium salsum TaxID=2666329 RepID=UPI0013920E1B|nr:TolC family protein [Cyclobacterium salsum]
MVKKPFRCLNLGLIYFLGFFTLGGSVLAQQDGDVSGELDLNIPIENQLPALDSLIDLAIGQHPTVRLNEALVGSAESRLKLAKKSWANLLRGYVDYGYGNQAIVTTGTQGADLSNIANGYRTGLNLSIPLAEIINRGDRIKLQQNELQATFHKTREMELVIAEQVIEQYNDLLLAQRLMNIRSQMQEKARTNVLQMEMEFNLGNLDATSYMRNAEIHTIAQSEYENAKSSFFVAVQKLELLIGVPLGQLIRKNEY